MNVTKTKTKSLHGNVSGLMLFLVPYFLISLGQIKKFNRVCTVYLTVNLPHLGGSKYLGSCFRTVAN